MYSLNVKGRREGVVVSDGKGRKWWGEGVVGRGSGGE